MIQQQHVVEKQVMFLKRPIDFFKVFFIKNYFSKMIAYDNFNLTGKFSWP